METAWFESWFDSPYYPVLYQHRNEEEAEAFVQKLLDHLKPAAGSSFLDLACGRGRHSRFLHSHGFDVTGLDLSPASIADANQYAEPGIQFKVHDMRDPYPATYDYILNLFTSFGYFNDKADNLRVLKNVAMALNVEGIFVLDFMNAAKVAANLVAEEHKELDGISFEITRSLEEGFIVKRIHVNDQGSHLDFMEQVQALMQAEILEMMEQAGLDCFETWGDYHGSAYEAASSDRLILFARGKE